VTFFEQYRYGSLASFCPFVSWSLTLTQQYRYEAARQRFCEFITRGRLSARSRALLHRSVRRAYRQKSGRVNEKKASDAPLVGAFMLIIRHTICTGVLYTGKRSMPGGLAMRCRQTDGRRLRQAWPASASHKSVEDNKQGRSR